jgi:hypothetical protein
MKTLRFKNYSKILAITVLMVIAISSCKKDDSDGPAVYVGEWITHRTINSEGTSVNIKDVIKFKESSFTEVASMQDPETNKWIDIMGRKGDFTIDGEEMDVTITSVGFTTEDADGLPTGIIQYYKDGTSEFYDLLSSMEMSQDYTAEYKVKGDKLTLKADNNNNGSYDEEDEVNVFTRL